MISVNYKTDDYYAIYGIRHFFDKYGLCTMANGRGGKINIAYGKSPKKKNGFSIVVMENEIKRKLTGWVITKDGYKIPAFEKPISLESNNSGYIFKDGNKSHGFIGQTDDCIVIGFDVFKEIGFVLSGEFEVIVNSLDDRLKRDILAIPFVEFYEKILFDQILIAANKLGLPLVQKSFWPHGKPFSVCLTHDVDEIKKSVHYVTNSLRCLKKRDLRNLSKQFRSIAQKMRGCEPFWTFEKLMALEDKYDAKSTLFFLQEDAKISLTKPKTWRHYPRKYDIKDPKVSSLIKEMDAKGWEIGLHGSYYSYNNPVKLRNEKRKLENIIGGKIYGIRQHNLNLEIPKTWRYQEDVSLEYDTTLGSNYFPSYRFGTSFPFRPLDIERGKMMSLLEIPIIMEDTASLPKNVKNWEFFKRFIDLSEEFGGLLTVLWHHSVFNEHDFPGWGDVYEKITKVSKERGAWITNCREICDWWKRREKSKISCDFSGGRLVIKASPAGQEHFVKIIGTCKKKTDITGCKILRRDENSITIKMLSRAEISWCENGR